MNLRSRRPRVRSISWAAVAGFCAALLLAPWAWAQRVILVCPPETDASLNEAFNRLRGELTMHGFEVEIQTAEDAISPENLAQRAESGKAVASVSFVRNEGYTTADIKISDRVTGKTSIRTIATPAGTDAASLLALRAVELLRASLREFGSQSGPTKDIVGASPQRANPTVAQWAQASNPQRTTQTQPSNPQPQRLSTPWTLRVDAVAALQLPDPTAAVGFGAALGFKWNPRFESRLVLAAPWFGANYAANQATSQLHLFSAVAEMAVSIPVGYRLELQPLAALGMAHVTTFTTTIFPLRPRAPSAWLTMPSLGLGLNVTLSPRWFWYTSARLAVLLPRAVLYVSDQRYTIGLPMVMVSSGLGVKF